MPPAAFPTETPDRSAATPSTEPEPERIPDDGRFATPPGADDGEPSARLAPSDEELAAPTDPDGDAQLGSGEPPASRAPGARAEAKAASRGRSPAGDDARADQPRFEAGGALQRKPAWRRPPQEERPGLATHWGEDRYSPAREVEFERADRTRPSSLIEIHYNDRTGARRMLPDAAWARAEKHLATGLTIRVVDADGQTLPALASGGRVVAVGAPGERYALVIENPTWRRFEVVASVDGLDVLDGSAARVDKRGYLIAAYSSVSIDGFRRSNDEVAAFRLGNVARSYAASKGQARNVGVLGFAFFDERRPPVLEPPPPRYRPVSDDTRLRQQADPFPGEYARPPVW